MKIRTLAATLVLVYASPAPAQVVINEILFDPLPEGPSTAAHQWVEIHNKGLEPVDLSGWTIVGRDGRDGQGSRRLPAVTIPASGYLVVHFAAGQDQNEFGPEGAHHYTQDSANLWNPEQDEAALYSPAGIVDYLAWRLRRTSLQPGSAHEDAVVAGIWQRNAALTRDFLWFALHQIVREIRRGDSAGRDRDSSDTNSPGDFDSNGGRHSYLPTPGRRNSGSIAEYVTDAGAPAVATGQSAARATAVPEAKKWTVLWYNVSGDTKAQFRYLLDLQQLGGSTDDVNIVVHDTDYQPPADTIRGKITSESRPRSLQLINVFDPPIIEARNPASAETLADFVEWGKANYPAEHYALVLYGDGQGWKFQGSSNGPAGRFDVDRLYPGEIKQALDGKGLDVLFLGTNYGAMVEMVAQVRGAARFLVASPDRASISLFRIQLILARTPSLSGQELANQVTNTGYGSVIDLQRVDELILLIRQWVAEMREAIPVFSKRDDPSDNVQVRIMEAARTVWRAQDDNFTDLYIFAQKVQADPGIPACAKRSIPAILAWIEANVNFYNDPFREGAEAPRRGLTVHLPRFRSHRLTRGNEYFSYSIDPHDHPSFAREVDGSSRRVDYFSSLSSHLPLAVEDEDGIPEPKLDPRTEWPRKPAPEFLFPRETNWQGLLEDLFNPVSDNHIVDAEFAGSRILPTTKFGGECRNPSDEITVPVGGVVNLSGTGSSDVDMANGLLEPYTHMWDLNHRQPCRQQPCRGPHEVDPGADALLAATDNLDADDEFANTLVDDLDARGPVQLFRCTEPGEWITHLIAGDDDHTEPYHNTLPSAAHVASQTRAWPSTIKCVGTPASFVTTGGAYPFTETGTWVFGDHAVVAAPGTATVSPRNFIPRYPFTVTPGPGVTELQVNDVPLPDGTTNTVYSDQEGILRTRFTAGQAGPGTLFIQPLGLGRSSLNFTVVNRLAPLPTDLQITPPTGNLTVGEDASLTIGVMRNGQPLGDAIVTAWSPTSTANFVNGTPFRSNTATQLRAGPTGRFLITFRPVANGPVHLNIVAGQIFRTLTLIAAGAPRRDPTSLQVLEDVPLRTGVEGQVAFRVLAVQQPVAGATVRVEVLSGDVSVPGQSGTAPFDLTTNAQGDAILRLTPASRTPIRLRATVPGTSLAVNAELVVLR